MSEPADRELEHEFERVVIGAREPGPIRLVEYDPEWPGRFDAVRAGLAGALGGRAMAVEHIGSTAVQGLAAKPIIDVLVTVADVEAEPAYVPPILGLGYELRVREPGHRMFRPPARDVHVHVWNAGTEEVADYLDLRDRLRSDAADRDAYTALKRELAGRDWPDVNYYARAKGPLIAEILDRVRADSPKG